MEVVTLEEFMILKQDTDEMKLLLKNLSETLLAPKVVGVSEICRMEGISRSQIRNEAYLLPNFGVSEYPTGARRWNWETYLQWHNTPPEDRRKMYQHHLETMRKKAM